MIRTVLSLLLALAATSALAAGDPRFEALDRAGHAREL